ncbi:MAG TPA: hypothetical protein PLH72_14405 [Vicinamibacterales bacterium]|nr:hypothetical protein [Vicinamibacterales bacterium]
MITDLIVLAAVVFAVAFFAAWLVSPALRAWIERPKVRFQDDVRGYDRARYRERHGQEEHRA